MTEKILFVVSYSGKVIGGHILSTISLMKGVSEQGYPVGLLIEKPAYELPDLEGIIYTLHNSPFPENSIRAFCTRSLDIINSIRSNHYDIIVAMDLLAVRHSIAGVLIYGNPLVQVLAGGGIKWIKPLCLPGILSFSEELIEGYAKEIHIPREYMTLSSGRVDFHRYSEEVHPGNSKLTTEPFQLLCISRLEISKQTAISYLLEQVESSALDLPINLKIIGDGQSRLQLEEKSKQICQKTGGHAQIEFSGKFRVKPDDLIRADLVIGQGRTIIEALACHIPAAVCGSEGYYGLVTLANLNELGKTNLTGRGQICRGSLRKDLLQLNEYLRSQEPDVYNIAFSRYDISKGAQGILNAIINIRKFISDPFKRRLYLIKSVGQDVFNHLIRFTSKRLKQ